MPLLCVYGLRKYRLNRVFVRAPVPVALMVTLVPLEPLLLDGAVMSVHPWTEVHAHVVDAAARSAAPPRSRALLAVIYFHGSLPARPSQDPGVRRHV